MKDEKAADVLYISKLIDSIESDENALLKLFNAVSAHILAKRIELTDQFISETIKAKAFPRIIGKPTRFSFWWRRIKLEIHKVQPSSEHNYFEERLIFKQRGKIIGNKIIKITKK